MSLDHMGSADREQPDETSDHALVVHVRHLDVLHGLGEAVANLPETTDQFVTIPAGFEAPQLGRARPGFPSAVWVGLSR